VRSYLPRNPEDNTKNSDFRDIDVDFDRKNTHTKSIKSSFNKNEAQFCDSEYDLNILKKNKQS
jgi:hypothetical protein